MPTPDAAAVIEIETDAPLIWLIMWVTPATEIEMLAEAEPVKIVVKVGVAVLETVMVDCAFAVRTI
jgi:hypothetical protein